LKEALSKIKYIFPAEKMQSNIAIFFSIFALFFAVGSSNVPCLNADTCSVGSDEVFSGTVTIQNNTNYGVKLTGNPTANRTITFPDADGTVKLAGATLTADKMLASDTNGEVAVTDKYPFTLGTAGQFLKVASTGLTMDFLTVGGLDSLTANAPYLSVNSSGAIDSSATLTASTPLKSNAQGQITASDLDPTTDFAVGSGTSGQQLRINSSANGWEVFTPSGGAGSFSAVASQNLVAGSVGLESNGQVRNVVVQQNASNELNMGTLAFIEGDSNYHNGYNIHIYNDGNNLATCDSGLKVTGSKFTNATTVTQFTDYCIDNTWTTACNGSGANCQTTSTRPSSAGNVQLINIDSASGKSNKYVLLYTGSNQTTNCCMWGRVIDVNPSTGTFQIGAREMIHDENTCNNNSACSYYSTSYNVYPTSITGIWDAGASKLRVGYSRVHSNSIGYYPKFTTVSLSGSTLTRDSDYANELTGNFYGAFSSVSSFSMFYDHSTALSGWCYRTSNRDNSSLWALDWTGTQGGNAGYGAYAWNYQEFWGNTPSIPASMTTENVQLNTWYDGMSGCGDNSSIHYDYDAGRIIKTMSGYPNWGQSWNYNNVLVSFNINNDTTSWKSADCDFSTDPKCYDAYYTDINNVNNENVTCQNVAGQWCDGQLYGNNMTYDDTNNKWYWIDFAKGTSSSVPDQNCGLNGGQSSCPVAIQFSIDANGKPVWERTFKYTFPDVGTTATKYTSWRFGWTPLYSDTYSVLGTTQAINPQVGSIYNNFGAVVIPDNISSYIGYVGQSANQGDAVNVISVGGIIDGQTGLTIGEQYYVRNDGTYGTTGEYLVGRAISSTEIYVSNTR
tara:strand:- start:99 stop:2627 length:2529 start_codon:yes stop_codon:yes gene_type:complete